MLIHHKILSYTYPFQDAVRKIAVKTGFANKNRLRVLIYHDIPPREEQAFARQLNWLKKDWNIISPIEFEKLISGDQPIFGNNLMITFDDGFISNRGIAERILNPMGIKAIFFVVSDFADIKDPDEAYQFIAKQIIPEAKKEDLPQELYNMQWSDLEALLEYGHTIGGHTKRHTRLSNGVSEDELHEELINSAIYMEKKLGNEVEHFAFTFGDIDSISLDALSVASKKFKYIYTGIRGDNIEVASPITIRRDAAAFLDSNYKYVVFNNNLLSAFLGGAADFRYKEPRNRIDSWSQLI